MSSASVWEAASGTIPVINTAGQLFEQVFVATAGQQIFVLTAFNYTPGTRSIFVYKNGAILRRATQYTETDSTHVTLITPCTVGDVVQFISGAINSITPSYATNGLPVAGTTGQILSKTSGTDYDVSWTSLANVTTLLDSPRVNIASASTINLSAIAATTRNIQITGSVQIDGFQITNGQVWVAKFAASVILKNNANIVTQSAQDIRINAGATCLIRATADNVVEIIAFSHSTASLPVIKNDFRLSLASATPVTTADITAANTIYFTPYIGNQISLYNGISWDTLVSAEIAFPFAAGLVANRPHDIFIYNVAGVPTFYIIAWANDTVRATALAYQDGVLVLSGDATKRYIGSIYATGANTTNDSAQYRYLYNYYNRVKKTLFKAGTAANWAYAVAAWRQANADATNQVGLMVGVAEESVSARVDSTIQAAALSTVFIGLCVDATVTTNSVAGVSSTNAGVTALSCSTYEAMLPVGKHVINWVENSTSAVNTTWTGQQGGAISGNWKC